MTPAETLVILDFGSQYTQLIARRLRELHVQSVILPYTVSLDDIKQRAPLGIILSGGPNSTYDTNASSASQELFGLGVPILGICYGLQLMAARLGGRVAASPSREYGKTELAVDKPSQLLKAEDNASVVWMSHSDYVVQPPDGFRVTAMSRGVICAVEDTKRQLFGLQFHPEVSHSVSGGKILGRFVDVCGFRRDWQPGAIIDDQIARIRQRVGEQRVVCALSGGVDSSVAATLVDRAIGTRQTCIFVDTGLLRKNEYEEVLAAYKAIGLNVKPVRAGKQFLGKLAGVTDPEQKRKIIGAEFIRTFEREAKKIAGSAFLVQGTLYPDVIESVPVGGASVTIKSHHNVGGLPEHMKLQLIEPLRELFKDEVRVIGAELGLPETIVQRQPFPGPGLAIRILGEVTPERIAVLQNADAIVREEINAHAMRPDIWQFFAVLLPINSVGVMGDNRTYEQVAAIRAVGSSDGMTADWSPLPHDLLATISSRVISQVPGINRVVYDITSKPPGTIEWE
jgi:GMP synthase (glutamine-hydrolysing)